jgi:hypothetical protein
MRKLGSVYSVTLLLVFLQVASGAGGKPAVAAGTGDTTIRGAWLNERLPADTLAYQRIPHPFGIFSTPKGSALDPALRSPANGENLRKIREGILGNVLPLIPDLDDARIRFLVGRLASPLEMAVFAAPAPSLLLAMHTNLDSAAALEAAIADFAGSEPALSLLTPLDADGYAPVVGMPAPAFLQFDAATGRLLIQVGPAVSLESFTRLLTSLKPGSNTQMKAIEQQLDQSGQGWFVWIDAEKILPVAQMFMPPENLAKLQASGLDKVRAAGIGWGVVHTKGRLGIVLDVAPEGNRQYLPFVSNELGLTSVGKPDAFVLLSLPTAAELTRIESQVLASMNQDDRDRWQQLKDKLQTETGVSIEQIFAALGPELAAIFDSVGDYGAIRLRDRPLFDRLMDSLARFRGIAPDSHRAHGKTFYHWSMPGDFAEMDADTIKEMGPVAELLMRQRDHLYWVQDGDFLYFASVPQPLLDRIARGADTRIDKWLLDQQRIDASRSFMVLTGTSRKLPMRLYHVYIELLQFLADVSDTDIDVWNMPTAVDLSLATEGALGFTVDLGDPYVSVGMTFENNPAEVLFGSGAGTFAAIGIIAAIAIPAYQDYTIRAHVSEGYNLASQAQQAVADYHASAGEFPPPSAAAAMANDLSGTYTESVRVMPGSGVIVVTFFDDAVPEGGQLMFEPRIRDQGVIEWVCSGTLEPKHMPPDCRDNPVPEEIHGGA